MPLTTTWWTFSEGMINMDQEAAGVYELGDAAEVVVYIGNSNNLKRRLLEHFRESGTCIKRNTTRYRLEYTPNYAARERELYDAHVRVNGKPPLCNEVRPAR